MKIVCTQENIKTGLLIAGRIISSSNTLPILNNILLKTDNGVLKISSTNLEIAIVTGVRCKIEVPGEFTVSSKTFLDLVNNLPNKNITLESKDGEVSLDSENYHTKLKTLPAEDFPLIPKVEEKFLVTSDAQEVKKAIDSVVFAASSNQTQPELSGVLLSLTDGQLRVVATDRYRLAEKKVVLDPKTAQNFEVILPQKTALETSRIIGNQKGNLEIVFSETQAAINFNETQIISRLVDGQYPPYREIIPTNFSSSAILGTVQLISALRAVSVFGQASNSVQVELDPQKQQVLLSSNSSDLGNSSVELPAKISGPGTSLILNYHYLLDCLAGLDSENVIFKTIDDNSPSLLLPETKTDYIYLVMPIKN